MEMNINISCNEDRKGHFVSFEYGFRDGTTSNVHTQNLSQAIETAQLIELSGMIEKLVDDYFSSDKCRFTISKNSG